MLRLHTLGRLSLDGAPLTAGRRSLALLALLAVAGSRGLSRDKIIGLLWPESDEERARNSLSQALSALRRELGGLEVISGSTELRLNAELITSDVHDFEGFASFGDAPRAVSLYEGPFLDGFFLKGAPGFERWAEEQRARLQHLYVSALFGLAEGRSRGDPQGALTWWRRLAAVEPGSARIAIGLMKALAASGDRAAALRHYRVHRQLLSQELGVEPDADVAALAEQLSTMTSSLAELSPAPTGTAAPAANHPADSSPIFPGAPLSRTIAEQPERSRREIDRQLIVRGLMVGAMVIIVGVIMSALRPSLRANDGPRRIVVASLANRTGDSTLDALGYLVADYLTDGLQRSGLLEVTDATTSTITSAASRDSTGSRDDTSAVRMLAESTSADLVVTGQYYRERDSLAVIMRLSDGARRTMLAVTEPVRISVEPTLEGLSEVRQRVLGLVATQLDSRLSDVLPAGSSSLPNVAAYGAYVDGLVQFQRQSYGDAMSHFQRAYQLDSTFVAPLFWQAFTAVSLGQPDFRRAAVEEMERHRGRLTPLDQAAVAWFKTGRETILDGLVALQEASRLAPGSLWTYNVGNLLNGLGRSAEAVPYFEQIDNRRGWLRGWSAYWRQYATALREVDHRRELETVREARRVLRVPVDNAFLFDEGLALGALGRRAEAARIVDTLFTRRIAGPRTRHPGTFIALIAMEFWSHGDTAYARQLSARAVEWFRTLPAAHPENAGTSYVEALYLADRWSDALPIVERIVAESPNDWNALTYLGLCQARLGARDQARRIMLRLASAGDSTIGPGNWRNHGFVRAARIAATLDDRDLAVQYIRQFNDRTRGLLARHFSHKDFDAISDFGPFRAVTRAVP